MALSPSSLGHAEVQPLPPAPRSLLLTLIVDPVESLGRLLLGPTLRARSAPSTVFGRRPDPISGPSACPDGTIPSDRDRAYPLSAPFLELSTPSGRPSAPTADVDALDGAAELHFGDSVARY